MVEDITEQLEDLSVFDEKVYFENIGKLIKKSLTDIKHKTVYDDLLLADYIKSNNEIIEKSNKLKIIQMKVGIIWQSAIGTYKEFTDLGQGHPSGLDILSSKRKIAIELKNRYNSDNASSRLSNYNKLAAYKKSNPEYTCIYAVINDNKPLGKHSIISHNNVQIECYSGDKLLEFIFGDDKQKIINELQKLINTCI